MAGFNRRVLFDLNRCEFEGRVADHPLLDMHKRSDGVEVEVVRFQVVCNSNPYSPKAATYFRCFAYGIKATRIFAILKKGYSVLVIAEAKSITTKPNKKLGIPSYQLNEFQVNHLYIIGVPDVESDGTIRPQTTRIFAERDIKKILDELDEGESPDDSIG